MMKKTLIAAAVLGSLGVAGGAAAQNVTTASYSGLDHINRIIRNTPGVNTVGTSTGVTSTATGPVNFRNATGVNVSIPVNAQAAIPKAAIAAAAGKVLGRAIPFVGAALIIKDIYDGIAGQGIVPCPDGSGGVCVAPIVNPPNTAWTNFPYPSEGYYNGTAPSYRNYREYPSKVHGCSPAQPEGFVPVSYRQTATVSCGFVVQGYMPVTQLPPATPAVNPESAVQTAVNNAGTSNPAYLDKVYDSIATLDANANPDVVPGKYPLDISAAPVTLPNTLPVTTPSVKVSTKQVTNPDGTTSTEETHESVKVTPTIAPNATVSNPQISFPSTITRTHTTTNNTTNTTTIIRETVEAPSPGAEPEPLQIPKDYNKEVTQQKILEALTAPITAEPPTGNDQLESQKAKIAEGVTAVSGITEGSTGLKGWLPTINTTSCVNPQVPSPISGKLETVNICDSVNLFTKFFGAVISVFALYGCVREVQSAMKA